MDDDVTVKSAKPKDAIPVNKAPKKSSQPMVDATAYWDNYFKTHDESPNKLFGTVDLLMTEKRFDEVEASIKGYLNWHKKNAEPWMYELLVKAIEERKGSPQDVAASLSFAAFLAKKTKNPNDLVRIADMMVLRKLYGPIGTPPYESSIGELLDLAIEKVPSHPYPPMMSINLATRTKDAKRMGDTAEQLLSLGWPEYDDKMRRDVKEQVGNLAKVLEGEGKDEDAKKLLARLAASEVRDVYVRLTWPGDLADLDLVVDEPLGATAKYGTPKTVFGGALLNNGYGKQHEEVYVCPRAFPGKYTIHVETMFIDEAKPITEATLEVILHEGSAEEIRTKHRISLANAQPIIVDLAEGRRITALPYLAPPELPKHAEKPKAKAEPASKPYVPGRGPIR